MERWECLSICVLWCRKSRIWGFLPKSEVFIVFEEKVRILPISVDFCLEWMMYEFGSHLNPPGVIVKFGVWKMVGNGGKRQKIEKIEKNVYIFFLIPIMQ
jgi:hypothetical protein